MMPLAPFIILCIVSILGSLGNISIIAAVCLRKKLRVRGNLFIVNLAVADLIITGYIMPMGLVTSHRNQYPFNAKFCHFNAFISITACLLSMHSAMLVAVERYVHICKTHHYKKFFTNTRCVILVACSWIYCMFWACQGWTGWTTFKYTASLRQCLPLFPLSYSLCVTLFCIVIPVITMAFCYRKIYCMVQSSRDHVLISQEDGGGGEGGPRRKEQFKRIQWLPVLLSSLVISCITFWTPFCVTIILESVITVLDVMYPISFWLLLTNSFANSILYGVMNTNFYREYKAIISEAIYKLTKRNEHDSSACQRDLLGEDGLSSARTQTDGPRMSPTTGGYGGTTRQELGMRTVKAEMQE